MNEAHTTNRKKLVARRWFLRDCGVGLGGMALASLLKRDSAASSSTPTTVTRAPHHIAKAKRVIYLFMAGAPSHLDLFDYKPKLVELSGTLPPPSALAGYRSAFINPNSALLGTKFKFAKYGKSGAELSELLPNLAKMADDICIVRSMNTDAVNHAPGQILMNTGSQQFGRPSLGAWTLYGLGCETDNLPGYVVLSSAHGTSGGASNWGCGFLPTAYAGVPLRSGGDPILYLSSPAGWDTEAQRASLDSIRRLNEMRMADVRDPEIEGRIQSYEMA